MIMIVLFTLIVFIIVYAIITRIYWTKCRKRIYRLKKIDRMLLSLFITVIVQVSFLAAFKEQLMPSSNLYHEVYYLRNINKNTTEDPVYYKYDKDVCILYIITADGKEEQIKVPIDEVTVAHDNSQKPYAKIGGYKITYPTLGNFLFTKNEDVNEITNAKIVTPYSTYDYFRNRNGE